MSVVNAQNDNAATPVRHLDAVEPAFLRAGGARYRSRNSTRSYTTGYRQCLGCPIEMESAAWVSAGIGFQTEASDWITAGIGTVAILVSAYTLFRGQALQRKQKRIEAAQVEQQRRINYLQGSKEQVAHEAMSVADVGFPEGESGRQVLRSMLLAATFENSGRARALVTSALRARYHEHSDLIDSEIHRIETNLAVFETLKIDHDDDGKKLSDFDVSKGQFPPHEAERGVEGKVGLPDLRMSKLDLRLFQRRNLACIVEQEGRSADE